MTDDDARNERAIVPLPRRGDAAFRDAIRQRFPDIAVQLDEGDGLHMAMGALARYVMDRIAEEDVPGAAAVPAFVDDVLRWPDIDPEFENAVALSFIEPVALQETSTGRTVWHGLPSRVRHIILGNAAFE